MANFNDLNKTNILFVLHEKIGTIGGTGFTNLDIINSLDKRFGAFILTSDGEDVELWKFTSSLEKIAKEKNKTLYAIYNDGALILNRENNEIELFGKVGIYK